MKSLQKWLQLESDCNTNIVFSSIILCCRDFYYSLSDSMLATEREPSFLPSSNYSCSEPWESAIEMYLCKQVGHHNDLTFQRSNCQSLIYYIIKILLLNMATTEGTLITCSGPFVGKCSLIRSQEGVTESWGASPGCQGSGEAAENRESVLQAPHHLLVNEN